MTDTPRKSEQEKLREFLLELKEKVYSPALAAEAIRVAEENEAKREPFDLEAYKAFIQNHPVFKGIHLYVNDYE
jgi:hypothetical protein